MDCLISNGYIQSQVLRIFSDKDFLLQPEQQVFVNFELALPSGLFNFKWLHSESSFKNIFGQFPKDKVTL